MVSKKSEPNARPMGDDWLELLLTQSGGFTGLHRQAKILKSDLNHALADTALRALQQLWDHDGNALPTASSNYPDAQKLLVEVTTKQGQWVQTLNADELPEGLSAICGNAVWKPVRKPT